MSHLEYTPDSDPAEAPARPTTYDPEAERAVLYIAMHAPAELDRLRAVLATADFVAPAHQIMWDAMCAVSDAGRRVDPLLVSEHIAQQGQLGAVQNGVYVATVWGLGLPMSNATHWVEILRRRANARRLEAIQLLTSEAYQSVLTVEDEAAIVERARDLLDQIVDPGGVRETLAGAMLPDFFDDLEAGVDPTAITTGLAELDARIGGLVGGQVCVVGARPGVGKTLLAQQIAVHVARDLGRPALLFTMEMSQRQMLARVVAAQCSVDAKHLRRSHGSLSEAEWALVAGEQATLAQMPLHIMVEPGLTPARLTALATAFKRQHGDVGVIVIDYIGLMEAGEKVYNRQEAISGISRSIKQLAQRLDVPIVLLSQLNRAAAQRGDGRPALTNLRDSGAVEQDADIVLLLHRDPDAVLGAGIDAHAEMEILIPKNREGDGGEVQVGVQLAFNRMCDLRSLPARQLYAAA